MKKYNVWQEGYSATGQYEPDHFMGTFKANNFKEACMKAMKAEEYSQEDIDRYYDKERNTFWGCRFYEQPPDASPIYFA